MRNSDRSTIRYEVLRGKWLVFRKINPTKRGGRVGSESTEFDFLLHNLASRASFPFLQPTATNEEACVDRARIFLCK